MKLSAYNNALKLLTHRDYGESELVQRLLQKGHDADEIQQAFKRLRELKYLDDQRSATALYLYSVKRGYGSKRVRQTMQLRGYDAVVIDDVFAEQDTPWLALAEAARCKRFGEEKPRQHKDKAKQQRFLYQRGFDADIIYDLF